MMKKRYLKIAALVIALILLGFLGCFANVMLGNPISKGLARHTAEEYLKENYGDTDYYIDRVNYSFKDGKYYAHIKSKTSIDTEFTFHISMSGKLCYSDYERVENGSNTANRIDMEYRELTDTLLESPEFPYECHIAYGTLEIYPEESLESDDPYQVPAYSLKQEQLELDKQYDIRELGKKAGHLILYVRDREVTVERMAEIMLGIKEQFDGANIPFAAMDFTLLTSEEERQGEENFGVSQFLYEDIYEDGMVERVQRAKEELDAYYAKEDAKKAESEIENEIAEETFSFDDLDGLEFYFASGAGAWRTVLRVDGDGSFSGVYSDSDMGSSGEGYPNGTCYYCEFRGSFTEPVKVDDFTYTLKIKEISCAKKPETSEIIDGIRYEYSFPYGIHGAEELLLFLPGASVKELPEEYMNWVRYDMTDPETEELPFYGLYNVTEQNGFSSYDISDSLEDYMELLKEQSDVIKNSLEKESLSQADMNVKSQELYELWDGALNYLWSELKNDLTEEEFEQLLEEQRIWIAEKEKATEEAGKDVEGGSLYALLVYTESAKITEERVYELYELLR